LAIPTDTVRDIYGLPIGFKKVLLRVRVRRIRCTNCGAFAQEPLSFCSQPYVRHTRCLARYVIGLRSEMSISAVARFTGLHWETVKNIEKDYLKKRYRRIRLKDVRMLAIDEVYLGAKMGYITVVRDLESGAVLYIGKGKGPEALIKFRKRIGKQARHIQAVCMDMSNVYSAWVQDVLPGAEIIYDHFHVIKLMNERMDSLRRSTMNRLEEEQKKELKNKRWLLLKNVENLSAEASEELKRLQVEFKDLGTASLMKEYLRNIYRLAGGVAVAQRAFVLWCEKAEASGVHCLKQMAKTIRRHMDGLLAYWKYGGLTNASQEGFNNKIGWLTRQAYGYRDEEYLHLKIFDLPNLSTVRRL